jgi:hypothetical protein
MKVFGSNSRVALAATLGAAVGGLTALCAPCEANTGNVTLEWTAPTQNSDGSVLTNLAGYVLQYGTNPSALTQIIKVTNPGLTSYVLDNLPSGTWYFAFTSFTTNGAQSTESAVVSTTIP